MPFRRNVRLDPSQIEDRCGRRQLSAPIAVGGGGIGLIAAILILLFTALNGGSDPSGASSRVFDELANQTTDTRVGTWRSATPSTAPSEVQFDTTLLFFASP